MHDEDEELTPEQMAARAFGGMKASVDQYKAGVQALRKGQSSGISGSFGNASDILPPEYLEEYENIVREAAVGTSVVKGDPGKLRAIVENMIADFHKTEEAAEDFAGVLFDEDGNKFYLPVDIDEDFEGEPPEPAKAPQPVEETRPSRQWRNSREILQAKNLSKSGTFRALLDIDDEDEDEEEQSAEQAQMAAAAERVQEPERAKQVSELKLQSEPDEDVADIRVHNAEGVWLWDVYVSDGKVERVSLSDGSEILKTVHADQYVYISAPEDAGRIPRVEVIGPLACEPETGNLFYQSADGGHAFALLNNGWGIRQRKHDDSDEYHVIPPTTSYEVSAKPIKVSSISIDTENYQFSYERTDGTMVSVPLTRRQAR